MVGLHLIDSTALFYFVIVSRRVYLKDNHNSFHIGSGAGELTFLLEQFTLTEWLTTILLPIRTFLRGMA